MNNLHMGVDVGSTTVKSVIRDDADNIVFSEYRRHFSDIISAVRELFISAGKIIGDTPVSVTLTGSGGLLISEMLSMPFVQEVIATKTAVSKMYPDADVVIELGGEDAKILYLSNGLESLHVRMDRHCSNALAVAKFLKESDKVAWVSYPDLEDDKYNDLAKKYLPKGSCGVLAFGIKGGREKSIEFMDSLKLAAIVTHVADARTCLLHPASHTHRQLTDEQLIEAGVAPDLIRLSVGIESVEDLIADLEQAFAKI